MLPWGPGCLPFTLPAHIQAAVTSMVGVHMCCQAALRTHHGCEASSPDGLQASKAGHALRCMSFVSSGLAP